MSLPPPAPRTPLHVRAVTYEGFLRDDGLWDIDASLSDTKSYPTEISDRQIPTGVPIHGMAIRVTVDEQMVIRDIAVGMAYTPYGECLQGEDPMKRMIGVQLGPGWRQAIERNLGGVRGCTHLRELLYNMATAAYQTVFPYRDREKRLAGHLPSDYTEPPHHLGRCVAWDYDGPVVARIFPQFSGYRKKAAKAEQPS